MKHFLCLLTAVLLLTVSCSKNDDVENPYGTLDPQLPDSTMISGTVIQDFLYDAQQLHLTDTWNINLPDRYIKDCCLVMHVLGHKALADNNHAMHSALCLKYGVKLHEDSLRLARSAVNGIIGADVPFAELADLPTYRNDFIGIVEHLTGVEVITDDDWDASHPAGTALNDMIRIYAVNHAGFMKALVSGEPDWYAFENGSYLGLLSEMSFDADGLYDFRIPLVFLAPPATPGLYPITVRATFANGKVLEKTEIMDWTENNIPPNFK